jgi:hypothetical protein
MRAKAERDRLFALDADVCGGTDGALAVQQAMRLQREAATKLYEALRDFEAITLRPWVPPRA